MPVTYDNKIVRPNRQIKWDENKARELMHCASDLNYFSLNKDELEKGNYKVKVNTNKNIDKILEQSKRI